MRTHRLNDRVTLRLRTDVPNDFMSIDSHVDGERRWAEVKAVSGLEMRHGEQVAEGVTHRVTMRKTELTGNHEIVLHDGAVLRVRRAYDKLQWNTWTTVAECEEYTP